MEQVVSRIDTESCRFVLAGNKMIIGGENK